MVPFAQINFQPLSSTGAASYLIDGFEGYADRGNGFSYGWVTEASATDADGTTATPIIAAAFPAGAVEERTGGIFDTYDQLLTTFAHMDLNTYPERAAWEIAVPNGFYAVTVSVGDTDTSPDSVVNLLVEGQTASEFTPTSLFSTELTQTVVEVTDGFLTLTAPAGTNTELQYIEIDSLPDLTPVDGQPAPSDYPEFVNLRAAAQDGSQVFEVDLDPATGFAENVDPGADLFLGVQTVLGRTGVSLDSLSDGSIQLFETLTGTPVSYSANTTAGADSVTISPDGLLKENTSYTIVIEGAQDRGPAGDDQAPTREFQKVATTFVTGTEREVTPSDVAFSDQLELNGFADGAFGFTSVDLSPDMSQIYVTTITGEIKRWDLDPITGAIDALSVETFAPGGDFDTVAGRRGIVGLEFDPTDPDVLWITDNWPIPLDGRDDAVPDFSGRISKVTLGAGGDLAGATVSPYITGLPRSNGDHVVNSLEFRVNPDFDAITNPSVPTHLLYVNVGSNTAMGAPDNAWGFRPERLLSAAVLEIDPSRTAPEGGFDVTSEPIPADGLNRRFADDDAFLKDDGIAITDGEFIGNFLHFDSNGVATVREGVDASSTLVAAFYDPTAPDAVAKIFASGVRNPYDLVWHSNGSLYVPTNGSAAGGSAPDDPLNTPAVDEGLTNISIQPDYLFNVEEGGYYGHGNELRDEFILNGGNPTAGVDPNEVTEYAVGTAADPNYRADDAYSLGFSRSPNGAIEYTSDAWGEALQGALIFTEYSGGNDLRVITFDANDEIENDFVLRDFDGDTIDSYTDPLDIVVNPVTGQIYMVTLNRATGASQLVRLDPSPPSIRVEAESLTIENGFTVQSNGNASAGEMLQATTDELQVASFTWGEASGIYTLSLGHFDENDGVAELVTSVNGVAVDAFLWDEDRGTAFGNATALTEENLAGILLQTGDVITFSGFQNGGEPLRFDYADFSFTGLAGSIGVAPENTIPETISMIANGTFEFSGADAISVADSDSDALTVTVSVSEGTVFAASVAGVVEVATTPETIVLSGSVADLNTALAGLEFTPTPAFVGTADITVTTSDGASTDSDVVTVTVDPFGDPDADIRIESQDPAFYSDRLHFSYIDEPSTNTSNARSFKDTAVLRIYNEGTTDLDILDHTITGPYKLETAGQLDGLTIAAGTFVDVTVAFDRASFVQRINSESAVVEGTLTLATNDQEDNFVTAQLAGLWQRVDEGGWEPNINEIWETFGFSNFIPGLPFVDSEPSPIDNGGIFAAFDETEILSPYWRIADGETEAKLTYLAQYSGSSSREIGIHRPFSRNTANEALRIDAASVDTQRILPEINLGASFGRDTGFAFDPVYGSATFTNETIPDNWQGDDVFGFEIAGFSSDPSLNNTGSLPVDTPEEIVGGHWTRIFQALDAEGLAIDNTYLIVQDFAGSNGDYNDNLAIIQGVTPVSNAPVVSAPTSISLPENGSFAFANLDEITISDPDPTQLTREFNVVVRANHGTLTVTEVSPTVVSGNGTGVLVIDGDRFDIDDLQDTLASLVYTPDENFDGPDTITVTANDEALSGVTTIDVDVEPGPDGPPVVLSVDAPTITQAGQSTFQIVVNYDDDEGLDFTSFDVSDIQVVDENGAILTPTAFSVVSPDAVTAHVTYTFTAPGGSWDLTKNGVYRIDVLALQVSDTNGASLSAETGIETFFVDIPVGDPDRIEAESLTISSGFSIQSNGGASGGQYVQATNALEQRAGFTFAGVAGTYDITVGHYDEADGQSTLSVLVNGFEQGSFVWDLDAGANFANATAFAETLLAGITLRPGDFVEIAGFQDAGEPLRTDYLDLLLVGPPAADTTAPAVQITATSALSAADTGTTETTISVTYADDVALDALSFDVTDLVVTGPGGALTVSAIAVDQPGDGPQRTVTYTVDAPGGTWDVADNGTYTIALAADAVADTSGNLSGLETALTSIEVDLTPEPFRVEAETWNVIQGFNVVGNGAASGGQQLQAVGAIEQIAQYVFGSDAGTYDITIGYFDENDGQSTAQLLVNGIEVDSWVWDVDAGNAFGNAPSAVNRTVSDVVLNSGDVLSIRGFQEGGEPLRTDYFDFEYTAPPAADVDAPVVQSVVASDLDFASDGTPSIDIDVSYGDFTALDALSFDVTDLVVTGPGGALTVSAIAVDQPGDGPQRTVTYTVDAPGGTWDVADNGTYTIALAADAVADTSGNLSGLETALTSIEVDLTPPAPDPFRIEAEAFTAITGFGAQNNGIASNNQYLQAVGSGLQEAEFVFNNDAGVYTLDTGYFDENDGQSNLSLLINNVLVDSFIWDADPSGPFAAVDNLLEHSVASVALEAGDVIKLSGTADGGEPLRVDYIDFTFESYV